MSDYEKIFQDFEAKKESVETGVRELETTRKSVSDLETKIKKEKQESKAAQKDAVKTLEAEIASQRVGLTEASKALKAGDVDAAYKALKAAEPKPELNLESFFGCVRVIDNEGKVVWEHINRSLEDAVLSDGIVYVTSCDGVDGFDIKDDKKVFSYHSHHMPFALAKSGKNLVVLNREGIQVLDKKGSEIYHLDSDWHDMPVAVAADGEKVFVATTYGKLRYYNMKPEGELELRSESELRSKSGFGLDGPERIMSLCYSKGKLYIGSSSFYHARIQRMDIDEEGRVVKPVWETKLKLSPYKINQKNENLAVYTAGPKCPFFMFFSMPIPSYEVHTLDAETGKELKSEKLKCKDMW